MAHQREPDEEPRRRVHRHEEHEEGWAEEEAPRGTGEPSGGVEPTRQPGMERVEPRGEREEVTEERRPAREEAPRVVYPVPPARGRAEEMPRERAEAPGRPAAEYWTASGPVRGVEGREIEDRVEALELNAAATVASPEPLGLAAYAASTFTIGAILAGWAPITGFLDAVPMFFVFGGLVQFIAAMWAFRRNSTFWSTFFGVFGGLYLTISLAILLGGVGILTAIAGVAIQSVALGVTVAMFAFIAGYLTWAATGVSSVMIWVLGLLTAYLALVAVGFFVGIINAPIILLAAGYCAIVSGLIAFYASAAIVVNSTMEREVLPY